MAFFRFAVMLLAPFPCIAQQPMIFDVATVVVGAQRIETVWAHAQGKWSDAGPEAGPSSTEIYCYKRFGFCEVASALTLFGLTSVNFTTFDILRWDTIEMIAVDSSPICVVNTLRFDFTGKKVGISSTSKGETASGLCKDAVGSVATTAFLVGATHTPVPKKK